MQWRFARRYAQSILESEFCGRKRVALALQDLNRIVERLLKMDVFRHHAGVDLAASAGKEGIRDVRRSRATARKLG